MRYIVESITAGDYDLLTAISPINFESWELIHKRLRDNFPKRLHLFRFMRIDRLSSDGFGNLTEKSGHEYKLSLSGQVAIAAWEASREVAEKVQVATLCGCHSSG